MILTLNFELPNLLDFAEVKVFIYLWLKMS